MTSCGEQCQLVDECHKRQAGLDLVLTPGLFLDHVSSGPEQTAIFDFYSRGNIDSFEFSVSEAAGKFAAIYLTGFACPLLVCCRYVSRIYHDAVDAFFTQLVMDPESGIAGFINSVIGCTREVPLQVVAKDHRIRWLGKGLMFKLMSQDAYTPMFLMNIQTDIKVLIAEIEFANVNHGKSPFGVFLSP